MSETIIPKNPTLFLCNGTSGAGLSTAIDGITKLGLATKPATQFTTRALRPNERRGDQFYSVPLEALDKIPGEVSLKAENYGNTYGFFHPGVRKMRKLLVTQNIILDALNSRQEWQTVLGENTKIITVYFAPSSPDISLQRIIMRSEQTGFKLSSEELAIRIAGNSDNISKVREFDYWLDTTNLESVLPTLRSIIYYYSFGLEVLPLATSVISNPDLIENLISNFLLSTSENKSGYNEYLLKQKGKNTI